MLIKKYRIKVIDQNLRNIHLIHDKKTSWLITAGDMESAWRKFLNQQYKGALMPNPAWFDIQFHSAKGV